MGIFLLVILAVAIVIWAIISLSNKTPQERINNIYPTFYNKADRECAELLGIDKSELKKLQQNIPSQYKQFRLGKRSGGYRTISAPKTELLQVQKTIYRKILLKADIHPAAKGFRHGLSIVDNAKPHLGKESLIKVDIMDFFGSIHQYTISKTFEKLGYSAEVSQILATLCCLRMRLPQGAPTSPALSNIIAYEMDVKLTALAEKYELTYTRYADDLTFSGDFESPNIILSNIRRIVKQAGFALKIKKTRFLSKDRRKIITGISISSGEKLTIPKSKKRELRKNIHFIRTKGLAAHQKHIQSTDPVYLKRTLGYLNFWLSVEPDNQFVIKSIEALKKLG